jgi:hypothetical protein
MGRTATLNPDGDEKGEKLGITYDYRSILNTEYPASTTSFHCTNQTQDAIPPLLADYQSVESSSPSIRIELVLYFHPLRVRDIHSLEDDQ